MNQVRVEQINNDISDEKIDAIENKSSYTYYLT